MALPPAEIPQWEAQIAMMLQPPMLRENATEAEIAAAQEAERHIGANWADLEHTLGVPTTLPSDEPLGGYEDMINAVMVAHDEGEIDFDRSERINNVLAWIGPLDVDVHDLAVKRILSGQVRKTAHYLVRVAYYESDEVLAWEKEVAERATTQTALDTLADESNNVDKSAGLKAAQHPDNSSKLEEVLELSDELPKKPAGKLKMPRLPKRGH